MSAGRANPCSAQSSTTSARSLVGRDSTPAVRSIAFSQIFAGDEGTLRSPTLAKGCAGADEIGASISGPPGTAAQSLRG
jgi:hypothetical protein